MLTCQDQVREGVPFALYFQVHHFAAVDCRGRRFPEAEEEHLGLVPSSEISPMHGAASKGVKSGPRTAREAYAAERAV